MPRMFPRLGPLLFAAALLPACTYSSRNPVGIDHTRADGGDARVAPLAEAGAADVAADLAPAGIDLPPVSAVDGPAGDEDTAPPVTVDMAPTPEPDMAVIVPPPDGPAPDRIMCGNGVKEQGETCDPLSSCPTACPAMGCQLRQLMNGGTCQAACQNAGMQTMCASGDGCCPPACNATNDSDCSPRCGNGVVERGETCEPVAECNRRAGACQGDHLRVRTGRGSAAACTFVCEESARACGPSDGFCPPNCVGDSDCNGPNTCVSIQFCRKPGQPNQGRVICLTNEGSCTPNQRIGECTRDARSVCGDGHARPVQYEPPIAGLTSG